MRSSESLQEARADADCRVTTHRIIPSAIQARTQAQNRSNWHHRIKALCASEREEGR